MGYMGEMGECEMGDFLVTMDMGPGRKVGGAVPRF